MVSAATLLARAEARLAAAAELVLFAERLDLGRYDFTHLRAIHRHLFSAVYDWAGEFRTVNMSKGDTVFALIEWLEPQTEQLFTWLAGERHLLSRSRDQFIEGASRLLSDLNALHPFREGNGRTQRAFLRLLAADAGWHLAWSEVDPAENAGHLRRCHGRPPSVRPAVRPDPPPGRLKGTVTLWGTPGTIPGLRSYPRGCDFLAPGGGGNS